MKKLIYVTGNPFKFEIAQKALAGTGIELEQVKLETPEIQSVDVEEIATFSARWACEKLNQPVAVTDAGYYIEALNGFPGPFIKYINQWLTADDLLKLMSGHTNRTVAVKGCLAYCEPGGGLKTFLSNRRATLSDHAVSNDNPDSTSINRIFIPEGYDKIETEIDQAEVIRYWSNTESYWHSLADFLTGHSSSSVAGK